MITSLDTKVSAVTICVIKNVGDFKDDEGIFFFLSARERKGNEKCIKKQKAVQESHDPDLNKKWTNGLE